MNNRIEANPSQVKDEQVNQENSAVQLCEIQREYDTEVHDCEENPGKEPGPMKEAEWQEQKLAGHHRPGKEPQNRGWETE